METTITILFRPSEDISEKILSVKKETGVYYPDHEDSLPHITLYSCKFDENKYEELISTLKNLNLPQNEFTLSELKFSEMTKRNNTFVAFDINDKEKLQKIHESVLMAVNPLRGNLVRNKDIERYKNGKMTEEEFLYTQKYGFLYFMEKYNPHITIGVIETGDKHKEELLKGKLSNLAGSKFVVNKIFVKLKKRKIPSEEVIFENESTEILL